MLIVVSLYCHFITIIKELIVQGQGPISKFLFVFHHFLQLTISLKLDGDQQTDNTKIEFRFLDDSGRATRWLPRCSRSPEQKHEGNFIFQIR